MTVIPHIFGLVNNLFTQSIFPDYLKLAVVTTIIKENYGVLNNFNNYRPVSIFPFLSKILERIMYSQLICDLERNNLPPLQSAYRSFLICDVETLKNNKQLIAQTSLDLIQ